jgi:hypothetical protein
MINVEGTVVFVSTMIRFGWKRSGAVESKCFSEHVTHITPKISQSAYHMYHA